MNCQMNTMRSAMVLSLLLGGFSVRPVGAVPKDIVVGAAIGSGVGIFSAFVVYSICSAKVRRERKLREGNIRKIEQRFKEIRDWLERLDGYYSTLPIEALRREADEKMAEVQALLAHDAHTHRERLNADARQVAYEIATLRAERDRMAAELGKQNAYLQQVQQFLQSVKDHHGESFLYAVIEARRGVEQAIMQLDSQRASLSAQLTAIELTVQGQQQVVHANELALTDVERSCAELDTVLTEHRQQLEEATGAVVEMVRGVEHTRKDLLASQREYTQLRTQLTKVLEQLQRSVNDVAARQQDAERQQSEAQQLLDALRRASRDIRTELSNVNNRAHTAVGDPQPIPTAPPAPPEWVNEDPQNPTNSGSEDPQ